MPAGNKKQRRYPGIRARSRKKGVSHRSPATVEPNSPIEETMASPDKTRKGSPTKLGVRSSEHRRLRVDKPRDTIEPSDVPLTTPPYHRPPTIVLRQHSTETGREIVQQGPPIEFISTKPNESALSKKSEIGKRQISVRRPPSIRERGEREEMSDSNVGYTEDPRGTVGDKNDIKQESSGLSWLDHPATSSAQQRLWLVEVNRAIRTNRTNNNERQTPAVVQETRQDHRENHRYHEHEANHHRLPFVGSRNLDYDRRYSHAQDDRYDNTRDRLYDNYESRSRQNYEEDSRLDYQQSNNHHDDWRRQYSYHDDRRQRSDDRRQRSDDRRQRSYDVLSRSRNYDNDRQSSSGRRHDNIMENRSRQDYDDNNSRLDSTIEDRQDYSIEGQSRQDYSIENHSRQGYSDLREDNRRSHYQETPEERAPSFLDDINEDNNEEEETYYRYDEMASVDNYREQIENAKKNYAVGRGLDIEKTQSDDDNESISSIQLLWNHISRVRVTCVDSLDDQDNTVTGYGRPPRALTKSKSNKSPRQRGTTKSMKGKSSSPDSKNSKSTVTASTAPNSILKNSKSWSSVSDDSVPKSSCLICH